jgi:hypothetical protein
VSAPCEPKRGTGLCRSNFFCKHCEWVDSGNSGNEPLKFNWGVMSEYMKTATLQCVKHCVQVIWRYLMIPFLAGLHPFFCPYTFQQNFEPKGTSQYCQPGCWLQKEISISLAYWCF